MSPNVAEQAKYTCRVMSQENRFLDRSTGFSLLSTKNLIKQVLRRFDGYKYRLGYLSSKNLKYNNIYFL